MEVPISKIKVKKRIRKELGNIKSLMESMNKNGLINPIVLNDKYELLAGYRRLIAAKRLGWSKIEAKVIKTTDELNKLEIELDENLIRKEFTPEEVANGINLKKELIKIKNMTPLQRFFYKLFKKVLDFIKKIFKFDTI
jgi:ParB family chromosome partitioning protein